MTTLDVLDAFEALLVAAEAAAETMRSGVCPACGAQPVDEAGEFDEDFAFEQCSTESWERINHAVTVAREQLNDARIQVSGRGLKR